MALDAELQRFVEDRLGPMRRGGPGAAGPPGADGTDGAPGADGADGAPGADGDQHVFVQDAEPPQIVGNVWIDTSTEPPLIYVWQP